MVEVRVDLGFEGFEFFVEENGDRAVGTQLADDHPGQAYLRRGEAYKGPAVLFGRKFFTAYEPVFGPSGKAIGILYVENEALRRRIEELERRLAESGAMSGLGEKPGD